MFKNPTTKEEAQDIADSMFSQLETWWKTTESRRASEHGGHYGACAKCEQEWQQLLDNSPLSKMDKLAKTLPSMYSPVDELLAVELEVW